MNDTAAAPAGGTTSSAPTPGPTPDPQAPPRRVRGRPFGSTTRKPPLTETPVGDGGATPPAGQEASEPQRKRRRAKAIDKDALAKQLAGLHMMAATVTGIGLIAISDSEAHMLADAIESVSREYDLALDGKTGAFIQLIAASAVVYGPRVLKFQALKRQAQAEAARAAEAAGPASPVTPVAPVAEPGLNGTAAGH